MTGLVGQPAGIERRSDISQPAGTEQHSGIDRMLAAARRRLDRLSPAQTARALEQGALLVDIRPAAQRAEEGGIPTALVIERNVLEWRLDPTSDARLPQASADLRVIVICSEGYTSSLAAASLCDLGLTATDVVGGYQAWAAAGLPTALPPDVGTDT